MKKMMVKILNRYYCRKGFCQDWGIQWLASAIKDFKTSGLPVSKRLWALRRGFYTYRIAQYNLTDENYKECLSDRDYKRLYPINNHYMKWIDDKLTMKYILKPFDSFLPKYYLHILKSRKCGVMKLMDCPKDIEASLNGVIQLLKRIQVLAVKPAGGSCGVGFCKLEFQNNRFFRNGEEQSETQLIHFLSSLTDYVVIEYVQMHSEIARLNPASLNTIRVMLINESGNNPAVASAFMRIGTSQSGLVDNTAQGGMFCRVDVETGRFYGGEKIKNHVISPSPLHPDTGKPVEGILPNWELVKNKLIEIANYLPQLEWMGFDIAITENGFCIIEINSHQGLHRYPFYPQTVKDYFNTKMAYKS